MNETRICTRCKGDKSLDNFYARKDGKPTWCKECCRTVAKARQHGVVMRVIKTDEEKIVTKGIARLLANVCSSAKNKKNCSNHMTAKHLRQLLKQQQGRCYYTRVLMKLQSDMRKDPYLASVDRIDISHGYEEGNVILCCLGMNWLRNIHSEEIALDCLNQFYLGAKECGKIK